MKRNSEFRIRNSEEGERDWGNEEFVIWYVKNVMIFAENSEMYIPKINCEKWYVFLRSKSLKTR